jgi:hypothetical protein
MGLFPTFLFIINGGFRLRGNDSSPLSSVIVIPAKAESHKLINNYKKVELIRVYYRKIIEINFINNILILIILGLYLWIIKYNCLILKTQRL